MSKVKIQIKSWINGSVLFEYESENNTIKKTVEQANLSGANLRDANLSGANLRDADLSGANLRDADLSGANLRDADLSGANLSDADLSDADLSGANLCDADLSDADLSGANLCGATVHYTDQERDDAFYNRRVDQFIYGTALESTETELKHNLPSCNRWDFTWKNVLKIKSWKLKADEAGSPAPSDTAEKSNAPTLDTTSADDKSNQDCDSKPGIKVGDSIVFQYGDHGAEPLRGKVIAIEGEKLVVKFVAVADHYYIVDQSEFTVIKIDE